MKNVLLFGLLFQTVLLYSQQETPTFNWAIEADSVYVTPPLKDIPIIHDLFPGEIKEHRYSNNMRRHKFTNENALPEGNDPVWQSTQGYLPTKAPIENWEGMDNNLGFPPDPSGSAGPNHYVQMVNSTIEVFDKQGNSLYGPNALSSILSSNNGDPIVMYDPYIDRWFVSGFGNGNSLSFALSTTNDPTGSYTVWNFSMNSLPDYPKYGIWHDGYYITANTSGPDCFVLERDQMILGAAGNPQLISMSIPSLNTGAGTQTGGFRSVLPAYADFTLPPATEKLNLFYFQDDAWNNVNQDEIKIWEVTVDWNTVSNSTITQTQTLAVTPFDSQFNVNWDDIEQPGTNQRLDGIPGAFMFRAQYTQWPGHSTVMLNHTVDVSATNHAGIRWYELRKTNGSWSVHQQSTYAPDSKSRWLGSISMDDQGNIGLAYSVAGPNTSASLMYTGRYASDPLNTMTLTEDTIVIGSGAQTFGNRFGDYAHMCVDPVDNKTFWYTGEYISGSRTTRIASFKLASDFDNDVGITALVTPTTGVLGANEQVEVTIKNFGNLPQNNFQVGYIADNGIAVNETYNAGPIPVGGTDNYIFSQTADLSALGPHTMKAYTGLTNDGDLLNDTIETSVVNVYQNDVGVTIINNPSSDNYMTMETITVTVENFGSLDQSNFDLAYTINGGTPVVQAFSGTLTAGTSTTFDFNVQGDFTTLGTYNIVAYTTLNGDADLMNDTTYSTIENTSCMPSSNCAFGDGITSFHIGSINNPSGCTPGGYSDYTAFSTDLLVGYTHDVTIWTNGGPQYVSIWIDYNDNFFFEASEKVVDGFVFNGSGTTDFMIAASKPLGSHLLRAKASDSPLDVEDPCSNMQYGETQDYTVNLTSDLSTGEVIDDNNEITVSSIGDDQYILNAGHFENDAVLRVHNSLGQLIGKTTIKNKDLNVVKIDLSQYSKGAYLVHIKTETHSGIVKLIK